MPRAVLDTNVLVSALITPAGAKAGLLRELRDGAFELVASPVLLDELREVLARPKFRRYVTAPQVDAYVEFIAMTAVVIDDPSPAGSALSDDPDDEFLIDLARAARVGALVTGDDRLLGLRGTIPVVSPAEFLASLR